MEKLKIKFEKSYEFCSDADDEKCICAISLQLPLDEEGKVHELLRDREYILCGTRLSANWGSWHAAGRATGKNAIYLSAPSWEALEEKVSEKIDELTEDFAQIKEKNESLLEKTPPDETVVVVI